MAAPELPRVDPAGGGAQVAPMPNRLVWAAFLVVCFLVTGLVGLFASYAGAIPLERAVHRIRVLDQALTTDGSQEAVARLLGPDTDLVARQAGDLPARVAAARAAILEEGEREAEAVGNRTRLMLGVVTVLAAGLGSMVLLLAVRTDRR
jgi:hypothetical protein